MRIDETDLRLALTAKRNAVVAARALVVQTDADDLAESIAETRRSQLSKYGWIMDTDLLRRLSRCDG